MKKAIAIVLSIMFAFVFTAATFAAEKKEAAPAEKKEAAPAEKKAEKKKVAHKQITGEVTAVDAKANTITVKGKKAEVTVTVDEKTKFMPKGKAIADVTAGEKVMVRYTEAEGKNTAKSVKIEAKKAEKKAKKAEKKMEEKKEAAPAPAKEEKKAPAKKPAAGY
jgi:microtubule-associated protein 1